MTLEEARRAIARMHVSLREIVAEDQEQEVRGLALPVLDTVISAAREHVVAGDPVLDVLTGLITAEAIEAGEPVRAMDALLAVEQLELALDRAIAASRGEQEGPLWSCVRNLAHSISGRSPLLTEAWPGSGNLLPTDDVSGLLRVVVGGGRASDFGWDTAAAQGDNSKSR